MQSGRLGAMLIAVRTMSSANPLRIIAATIVATIISTTCCAPFAYASGETITASDTATTEIKQATIVAGITINGAGNATVPVKLRVSQGTLAMSTTTGLTFTGGTTGSTLYFSGTRTDVNTALATLTYTRNSIGTDALEISLVDPGEVFFEGTGHLYEYVSATLDWNGAKTAAEGRSKYGATGYLATITSQAENDFVSQRLTNAGWMGASDSASEAAWKWVTGPENGTQFCQGNITCNSVSSRYVNWNTGEPNDSGSNEDCGQFLAGGTGKWNDLPCSGTTLPGYVVEYGATGNLPAVAAKTISLTTGDAMAPTTPGTPSATSPTTNKKPTLSWTASTDAGVGMNSTTPYAIEWSQSSTFANGVSSGTSTTNSFTPASDLADGTWYFRARALDAASNYSAYSANRTVVIDNTGPTQPTIASSSTTTHNNTPTLTWGASTDGGVGLGNPTYTVQWANNSGFSGASSATTDAISHTSSALSDGTWYFRIRAIDQLSNVSSWSNTVTFTVDVQVPTTPSMPTATSPTNDSTPTLTWTGASDGGSGLANPAYTVQWSLSNVFASGVSSDTTNTASFTAPTLADGIWYFRVKATDNASNDSAYSAVGSVVIDATPASFSDIAESAIADATTTIIWTTDELTSSQMAYGPTTSYGTITAQTNTSPRVTSHSVTLSGLVSCTLYHYQVMGTDSTANTSVGVDKSFITTGCAGASDVVYHSENQIDKTAGGSLALTQGQESVSLQIPVGFSANNADFQIKQLDSDTAFAAIGTPSTLTPAGPVYDFKAMRNTTTPITTFDQPIQVTMNYTEDILTKLLENSLTIYRWDDGTGWQQLQNCSIDTVGMQVTCETTHFSTFGLFGQAKAPIVPSSSPQSSTKVKTRKSSESTTTPQATEETVAPAQVATNAAAKDSDDNKDDTVTLSKEDNKDSTTNTSNTKLFWAGPAMIVVIGILWWIIARRRRKDEDGQ
jgi:hypothetical protein